MAERPLLPWTLPVPEIDLETIERAEAGDADRQVEVGKYFASGLSLLAYQRELVSRGRKRDLFATVDEERDVTWFRMAARAGHPEGRFLYGHCYLIGHGVPVNRTNAFRWIVRSAGQGFGPALAEAGVLLLSGQGVRRDERRAVELLQRGARKRDYRAECVLGRLHEQGGALRCDRRRANALFDRALEDAPVGTHVADARGVRVHKDGVDGRFHVDVLVEQWGQGPSVSLDAPMSREEALAFIEDHRTAGPIAREIRDGRRKAKRVVE